jgi:hypothetical protein
MVRVLASSGAGSTSSWARVAPASPPRSAPTAPPWARPTSPSSALHHPPPLCTNLRCPQVSPTAPPGTKDQKWPFATIVTHDTPGWDEVSHLDRPEAFRLNLHVGRNHVPSISDNIDYSRSDTILPTRSKPPRAGCPSSTQRTVTRSLRWRRSPTIAPQRASGTDHRGCVPVEGSGL